MLVTQPGGSRIVKVLDFGICRLQDQTKEAVHLTRTGSVFGTPRYMSPEQARGEKDIDARADLYSVGVILYRAVTGHFPFRGDNYNALLNAIANDDPMPPSDHLESIPEGLEAIIMKAIARNIDERYQEAANFIEALAPYSSVPPPIPTVQPTARKPDAVLERDLRATIPGPPTPVEDTEKSAGTPTTWDTTSGRRWSRDNTWLLPASIVMVLVVAGVSALAMFVISRMNRQEQELERMTRVIGAKGKLPEILAEKPAEEPAPPEPPPLFMDATAEDSVLLDFSGLPEGAEVFLDGKPLPQIPILIEASSQPHAIRIEAPGHEPEDMDVTVTEDTTLDVRMQPTAGSRPPKKGQGSFAEPPIDMKYPGMVGKKKKGKK
jgi:serine/threonine-protein kinase